jgi:hypothetical protein
LTISGPVNSAKRKTGWDEQQGTVMTHDFSDIRHSRRSQVFRLLARYRF